MHDPCTPTSSAPELDRKAELRAARRPAVRAAGVPRLLGRDQVEDARAGDFIERPIHMLFST
ncbi:MAG: hypothetical protein R3A48_10850 [Polyangiales bacterium]